MTARKRLAEKLGIRDGMRVVIVGAPSGYRALLAPLPQRVALDARPSPAADLIHYFVEHRGDLESGIEPLANALRDDAVLWISWPKKSSGRPPDLSEDVLREVILLYGLVDVKMCAVDDVWSGLKFVRRLQNRR